MASDLYLNSARDIVSRLNSGDLHITETLDCLQDRIEQVEPKINALPTLCFERAYNNAEKLQAQPAAQRGILCGLPVTIKDLRQVKGVRCTNGSRVFEHHVSTQSDRLVTRIERDGGIVYAKSNTPEFGTGGITFNDVFGITRTPYNCEYSSGGSSGGAAASLASGSAWLSHGSDMAGSLRTPASFCGVTSLRPSPGTVLADSEYLPFDVLGAEGPMARDIRDLALFADAMRADESSSMQRAVESESVYSVLSDIKVAVSRNLGIADISDDINTGFDGFIENLLSGGGKVVEAQPDLDEVHNVFDSLRAHSYAINLEQVLKDHPAVMKEEVEWNIKQGLSLTADKVREATRNQGRIVNRASIFMRDFDVLICPATSVSFVKATLRYPGSDTGIPIPDYYRWLAIAYATTVTTLPVITLPCGQLENKMPLGVQLVGKPFGEAALFRIAALIEEWVGGNPQPIDPR